MSKWRPVKNCIYVISDIHGMYNELQLILSRILPLRHTGGSFDKLIFLGDYIDYHSSSDKVIDLLVKLKNEYKEQIIFLKGDHETRFLEVLNNCNSDKYVKWMDNGGDKTLYGYLKRFNLDIDNPFLFDRKNIWRIVPQEHLDFLNDLYNYHENDNYIFVHGGCDPLIPLKDQNELLLISDSSVFNNVKKFRKLNIKCPWDKTIITGHNGNKYGKIFIYDKFYMLDGSLSKKIYSIELNSKTGFYSEFNNKRLVKIPIV